MRGRLAGSGLRPWPPFLGGLAGAGGASAGGAGSGAGGSAGRQDLAGEEQELGGVERLGLAAVALAEELFELVLELLVEVGLLGERLQQLADELMAGLEVGGQFAGRGRHAIITHRPARRDNKFSTGTPKRAGRLAGARRSQPAELRAILTAIDPAT